MYLNSLFGMSRAAKRPRCQDDVESNSNASSGLPTEVWAKVLECEYNIFVVDYINQMYYLKFGCSFYDMISV